ncbi:hypothetical protein [Agitococcus lubricus]|uniref:Lipoprotein n=1 Tax=Agitococcus lubricus TaxID=1077255 RepID=A0A2T5ISD6_9GAMM|nr:hypothetical protein [Agitococcus lubricus]PTQ86738.1 hypothetical protein C8N29_1325 [Agitococcus lubricus]
MKIYLLLAMSLLTACSQQAWYQSTQEHARLQCQKAVDINEQQRCLQALPDYQPYQQQRKELALPQP